MKFLYFFVLLVSISLIADVDAGWKFWKKKKDDNSTTTEAPLSSTPEPSLTPRPVTAAPVNKGPTKVPNTQQALAGAADPGLVIGAGNTGGNIKENARPQRPNPGTEVGLDLPRQKPANGYRDWAADLTGDNDGRQPPKVPNQGPALSSGHQTRPGSPVPGTPIGQQPTSGIQTPRPATPGHQTPSPGPGSLGYPSQPSRPGSPSPSGTPVQTPGHQTPSPGPASLGYPSQPSRPGIPSSGTPVPTPKPATPGHQTPSPGPASLGYPSQPSRPGSPSSGTQAQTPKPATPGHQTPSPGLGSLSYPSLPSRPGSPTPSGNIGAPSSGSQSPTGGKTFAQAASGGSKPGSPTPAPKIGVPSSAVTQPSAIRPGAAVGAAAGAAGIAAAGATQKFSSDPKYSKGNDVTNEDLEKLSEALFMKDTNNAMKFITLNLQKQTSGSSPVDEAPQPLFNVQQGAFKIPTIEKMLTIYDNYNLDTSIHEHINAHQREEERLLVDTFLSKDVMNTAMKFLAEKGRVKKDFYEYEYLLKRMWFNLYSRGDGKIGSSGFEHVFMSEIKSKNEVLGLHNWIYFNAEEMKKKADYLGYIKKVDLGNKAAILKIHTKFDGVDKPVTTMFVGTSPELEMALYTVCFLTRPDQSCPVSLGGTKFNIITHKFRYRGNDLVGSAYPEI